MSISYNARTGKLIKIHNIKTYNNRDSPSTVIVMLTSTLLCVALNNQQNRAISQDFQICATSIGATFSS